MITANSVLHIDQIGLFTEYFESSEQLKGYFDSASHNAQVSILGYDFLDAPRFIPRDVNGIAREDRALLADSSTMAINAVQDAIRIPKESSDPNLYASDGVFVASDAPEHNFTNIAALAKDYGNDTDAVYAHLGELAHKTNPLNTLRSLSTNSTYHISKLLGCHGGGYPLSAASLSGLLALEEAKFQVSSGYSPSAWVVASGNMRTLDSLAVYTKLGLINGFGETKGIVPSYGAASLHLTSDPANSIASILDVRSFFVSEGNLSLKSWRDMFLFVKQKFALPDIVVSYATGEPAIDRTEQIALSECFPGVSIHNYKHLFGYTGKANNLLDLLAALYDPRIEKGSTMLINGSGMGYGTGYILATKD